MLYEILQFSTFFEEAIINTLFDNGSTNLSQHQRTPNTIVGELISIQNYVLTLKNKPRSLSLSD
jgi:hypothetical protein